MDAIKIIIVSPSGTFDSQNFQSAIDRASSIGFLPITNSQQRPAIPSFLNGSKHDRLRELTSAEKVIAHGIWCARGGCGAIELWHDYQKEIYQTTCAPLIGYSDISIYHFMRFYRAGRIGIHGPILLDLLDNSSSHIKSLSLLIKKQAEKLIYPALKNLNHFLCKNIEGELIPMNLMSLQSIVGCFNNSFFRGKILALEEVNEPHYKVFRAMQQLKNASVLAGLKGLIIGYFGKERKQLINETFLPLANELGIPLFDWPIFGHEKPNWPLLFGAKVIIRKIDGKFSTLSYQEQHDHSSITTEP